MNFRYEWALGSEWPLGGIVTAGRNRQLEGKTESSSAQSEGCVGWLSFQRESPCRREQSPGQECSARTG